MKFTMSSAVAFVKDWFGLIALVFAGGSALGVTLSPPWANASEVEAIQEQLLEVKRDLKATNCTALRVLLRLSREDLERAEEELKTNPTSPTTRRAKAQAEADIASLSAEINKRCV